MEPIEVRIVIERHRLQVAWPVTIILQDYQSRRNVQGLQCREILQALRIRYTIVQLAFKHEMQWALQATKLDFVKIAESYPVKLQMLAITAKRDNYYIFDSWLDDLCRKIIYLSKYDETRNKREQDMLNYIETFKSRNILWSFLAAVMVQVHEYSSYFTPEFKMKLFNATKEIVNQVPSLKKE